MHIKALLISLLLTAPAWPAALETATQLNHRAVQLYRDGRYAEAEALYVRALTAPSDAAAPPEEGAVIKGNLGMTLRAAGRYSEAERLLTESVAELELITGPTSAVVGHALGGLATVYRAQGDLVKAEAAAKRAESMVQGTQAAANRLVLASIFVDQRRYQEAEILLKIALEGAHDAIETAIYNDLAAAALGQGQVERSALYARQAVDSANRLDPPDPVLLAAALNNRAQANRFAGSFAEAEGDYRAALRIYKGATGASHPDVGRVLLNLGALYHERGRESGASEFYQRAVDILSRALGQDHPQTLLARSELADVLRAEHHYAAATTLAQATMPLLQRVFTADDPRLIRALSNYARLLSDTHHTDEAKAIVRRLPAASHGLMSDSMVGQ